MLLLSRKKKSTSACENCKIARVKCSGVPQCERCIYKKLKCIFNKQLKRGPKPRIKTSANSITSELIKDTNPTCASLLNDLQKEEQSLTQKLQSLTQKLHIIRRLTDVVKTRDLASYLTQDIGCVFNNPINYINFPEQQNSLEYLNSIDPFETSLQENRPLDCNSSQTNSFDSLTISYPSMLLQEPSIIDCNSSQSNLSNSLSITYPSTLLQETSMPDYNTSRTNLPESLTNAFDSRSFSNQKIKFKYETPETIRKKIILFKEKLHNFECHLNPQSNSLLKTQQIEAEKSSYSSTQIPIQHFGNELIDGLPNNNFMEYMGEFPFLIEDLFRENTDLFIN
ncbi:9706_t:CDS:1 [Scutellospora calospora]|uniref:9706_t:CDS:1 n=1 Tax=Scutellospora calospora TaxID=85575 RepID=A0ACA9L0B8_9GLOM|nr:9706_t:CDS:1 [Scutellospora calospora]